MPQVTLLKNGFSLAKRDFQSIFRGIKNFIVEEKKEKILIKPDITKMQKVINKKEKQGYKVEYDPNEVIYYEDKVKKEIGINFPNGINSQILIDKIDG